MSFLQFPHQKYIRVLDTNEETSAGSFALATSGELTHIRAQIYFKGTITAEKLQLKIYSNNNVYLASSDIITIPYSNWIGWLRFDFNRINMLAGTPYKIKIVASDYTRNADTLYMGFILDWPDFTYSYSNNLSDNSMKMELFTYAKQLREY